MPYVENLVGPGSPGGAERFSVGAVPGLPYTPAMINEAAESILEGMDENDAVVMRKLWAADSKSDFAQAMFSSLVRERAASNFPYVHKQKHHVNVVLTADEVVTLGKAYPEFELVFLNNKAHDHPLPAACRPLDKKILRNSLPPGLKFIDWGANVLYYVEQGFENVVCVGPVADDKDPMRKVKMRMRLQMIAAGKAAGDPTVKGGEVSVRMANSILNGDKKYLVEDYAQVADVQAKASISCHVYDIKMEDWAGIMERSGVKVHAGCVHMSSRLFEEPVGVMESIGMRYQIDTVRDTISMGFIGSAASWYEHKWSSYMKYGVDQVLLGKENVYSYKIVERRGDTIYFRILEVGPRTQANTLQYYDTPKLAMVQVESYELAPSSRKYAQLLPVINTYPQGLWERMVRDASLSILRSGRPDINKLAGTYRVATVQHTLNGVITARTMKLDGQDVPKILVDASMAAYADVLLLQIETQQIMRDLVAERDRVKESVVYKGLAAFMGGLAVLASLPFLPFKVLADKLDAIARARLADFLVKWRPVARIVRFKASMFLDTKAGGVFCGPSEAPVQQHLLHNYAIDRFLDFSDTEGGAANLLKIAAGMLPEHIEVHLKGKVKEQQPKVVEVEESVGVPPSYHTEDSVKPRRLYPVASDKVTVERVPFQGDRHQHRVNAIKEAIVANELETRKVESSSSRIYAAVAVGGRPNKASLIHGGEKHQNPDLWRVTNGVIAEESMLGSRRFQHAAVWLPVVRDGSNIVAVRQDNYSGPDTRTGRLVEREHFVVGDPTYSGWALTTDDLMIFNGPNILRGLRLALDLRHDYEVVVNQGGPGAGKTTAIKAGFELGDVCLCPVRASTEDTRKALVEKFSDSKRMQHCVRTLDSYLVNYGAIQSAGGLSADVVHCDEAYMTHSGKWYAAVALLGAKHVIAHGDVEQIPDVPRVDAPKMYTRLVPDVLVSHWMVYRCAPVIMAMWAGVYQHRLRTEVQKDGAFVSLVKSLNQVNWEMPGTIAVLVMYQAYKLEIDRQIGHVIRAGGGKIKVMTVHESEGKTFDHTVLVNFEMRDRSQEARYLYNLQEYVLVGTSRSRTSFTYVKTGTHSDLVTAFVEYSKDPARVKAVSELGSVGRSVQFA